MITKEKIISREEVGSLLEEIQILKSIKQNSRGWRKNELLGMGRLAAYLLDLIPREHLFRPYDNE